MPPNSQSHAPRIPTLEGPPEDEGQLGPFRPWFEFVSDERLEVQVHSSQLFGSPSSDPPVKPYRLTLALNPTAGPKQFSQSVTRPPEQPQHRATTHQKKPPLSRLRPQSMTKHLFWNAMHWPSTASNLTSSHSGWCTGKSPLWTRLM